MCGYQDHDANFYAIRYSGGSVDLAENKIKFHAYRVPFLKYTTLEKNAENKFDRVDHPDWIAWFTAVKDSFIGLAGKLIDICKFNCDIFGDELTRHSSDTFRFTIEQLNRIVIQNEHELMKWFQLNSFDKIVRNIYEAFPKNIVRNDYTGGKGERFYVRTFANERVNINDATSDTVAIPGLIPTADGGEIVLIPPHNSQANVTRVYVNQGVWIALCRVFGYKTEAACALFEEIFSYHSDQVRGKAVTSVTDLIDFVARDGHNPCGAVEPLAIKQFLLKSLSPKRNQLDVYELTTMIYEIVERAIILKIFSLVSQAISLEDFKIEIDGVIFYKGIPDEQFKDTLEVVYSKFMKQQLKPPVGSMAPKCEWKILPVTTKASPGYHIYAEDRPEEYGWNHDSVEYTGYPCVVFNELHFESSMTQTDSPFKWVDIQCLHEAKSEEMIAFNRLMHELEGVQAAADLDSICRISTVYPHNLKRAKPETVGMRLEKNQWPLIYSFLSKAEGIVAVGTLKELTLYNQQTIYGPHAYLVDTQPMTRALLEDKKNKFEEIWKDVAKLVEKRFESQEDEEFVA